jgi:hypothetical protein
MSRYFKPRVGIVALSVAAVAYLAVKDLFRTPPGPLAAAHQSESELEGFRSCARCHGGWFGSMAEACLECHQTIGAHIEGGTGLHGAIGKEQATRCAFCHSEHHGAEFQLINRASWTQAGFPSDDAFRHEFVGFTMDGKHLELECAKCHKNANVEVLAKGQRRFGGLSQDCKTCHEDPHQGRMVLACARCHGQQAFDRLEPKGHEKHLALVGGHADVRCRDCHHKSHAHSLEALGSGRTIAPRQCVDCHESPHRGGFVEGAAGLASMDLGRSCIACHAADHTSFRDERLEVTAAQHACSGFRLEAPHDQAACADCHAPDRKAYLARYPGRRPGQCAGCHPDPHGGQFDRSPVAAGGCLACHERQHFKPHAFTVEKHLQTAFALTGSHREAECNACHRVPGRDRPRVFRGTPTRCERCHEDAHRDYFRKFAETLGRNEHGTCAACHSTRAFSAIPGGTFDHGRWTGFPILGAHAQSACESCHARSEKPDRLGRSFGWIEARFGRHTGCVTCHTDPHRGEFDTARHPREVDGQTGCKRCHVETSFRLVTARFNHGRWTGFPVEGAHREVGCSACHAPLLTPDARGRTWGRARGRACADCHADPHAGQFRVKGRTDCARCHWTTAFTRLRFDHDRDSRFPLGEMHEDLACSACHKPVQKGADAVGKAVVRFRPLARKCVDCHGAPVNPFRRRKGSRQ